MTPTKPLPGSERVPMPGAREIGPANPNEQVEVTIRLRPPAGKELAGKEPSGKKPPSNAESIQPIKDRTFLTRQEFARQHGADPAAIARVASFAHAHNLTVKEESPARRTVILTGTVAAMNAAFGVALKQYEHPSGNYRGRTGPIHLPEELHSHHRRRLRSRQSPQAKPHFRRRRARAGAHAAAPRILHAPASRRPLQFPHRREWIRRMYRPHRTRRRLHELLISPPTGTNSIFHHAKRFRRLGRQRLQCPSGDADGPDGEVMLDIEVAGSIAHGAKIVVYFADNTDAGFLNAITTAAHDSTHSPSIISISWGGPESTWTAQAMTSMNEAFQSAAAMGVTVCVAAGDDGSTDGVSDGLNHVDFPASSPNVLACGGTKLVASANAISSEVVWNELASNEGATGGGVSDVFPLPAYQNNAGVPPSANPGADVGRGVPGRFRRCRPQHRLQHSSRRPVWSDRRHQRRSSALGRPDRVNQSKQ